MARAGHVYVMRVSDEAVKVGFSNNPERRSVELGALDVLHHTEWLEHAELIERSAHRLLKLGGKHIKDEVFSASVKEAIAAINDAIAIADGQALRLDARPPIRNGRSVSVRMPDELREAIDAWRKTQRVEPDLSAVIIKALWEFLEKEEGQKK